MFTNLSKGLCLGLLSVLLLISYSSSERMPDRSLWEEAYNHSHCICTLDNEIDSVFMLSGDTFFKYNSPDKFDRDWIYRINSTRYTEGYKLPFSWKNATRMTQLETAITSLQIDLNRNIYAFDYQFDYSRYNFCLYPFDPYNECKTHWNNHTFVCLYGYALNDNSGERVIKAMSYDLQRFTNLTETKLDFEVQWFCRQQYEFVHKHIGQTCDRDSPMTGFTHHNHLLQKKGSTEDEPLSVTDQYYLDQYFVCKTPRNLEYDIIVRLRFPLNDPTLDYIRQPSHDYDKEFNKGIVRTYKADWHKRTHLLLPIAFHKETNINTNLILPITFRNKNDIIFYNCRFSPLPCIPSKSLSIWERKDQIDWGLPTLEENPIEMSHDMNILKLLRCPKAIEYQLPDYFNHNHFCEQKSFKSIFNLGADIYFQAHSRIWRYDRITPLQWFTDNIMPTVRYDSYTTSLLHKYFRLDLIIFGLTLRIPEGCNSYTPQKKSTKECEFLPKYQHRLYITCLFGYDKTPPHTFQAHPFIKTIAGIKVYPKDHKHYNDSKFICDAIGNKGITKTWNETLMPIGVIDNLPFPWRSFDLDPPHCCHEAIIHTLRFYNRKTTEKENDFTITRDVMQLKIWMKDKPDSPLAHYDYDFYPNIEGMESTLIEGGVFTTTRIESSGYFYKRDADLSINSSIPLLPGNITNDLRHFDTNSKNITILQLFNCSEIKNHFHQRYSLVPIRDTSKWLCKLQYPDDSNIPFSVFNIGEYVYFQNERQFFRYIPEDDKEYEQGFYYDKQVSELLNDIFETSERVIGLSFSEGKNKESRIFRVVVMGQPKSHYKVRFNTNVIYHVFHKERGPFSPLTPIPRHVWFSPGRFRYDGQMHYPLDAAIHFCEVTHPLENCTPPFVMRESVDDPTIVLTVDAMGFLQSSDNFIDEFSPEPNKNSLYPSIWAAVVNTYEFYSSRHGGHLYYIQLYLPTEEMDTIEGTIKKVYGLYSLNETLYVVAVLKEESTNELKVFQISDYTDGTNGKPKVFNTDNVFYINKYQKYKKGPLHRVFKCETPTKSSRNPNESKSSTAMVLIFICLIIVLVILLIIVGFMAYKRFESNKQTSEDAKQMASKNQSKNEDKPSSESKSSAESAMSSKTLRNEDINTVS